MNRTPMSQSYVNSQAGQDGQAQQAGQAQQQPQPQPQTSGQQQTQQQPQQQASSSSASATPQGQQQLIIGSNQSAGEQMSQLMCATELTNLLLEFAFSVFVNKPQNIVEYAANYFNQLKSGQPTGPSSQQQASSSTSSTSAMFASQQDQAGSGKRASSDSQRSNLSQNSYTDQINNNSRHSEDEIEFEQQQQQQGQRFVNFQQQADSMKPKTSYNRRKSVFAEQYDPANDQEDDENNRVVHSKTDEQRLRLAKAIKAIFLFRSVDPQDMTNLLDAMFEVKVRPGDVVIKQGDDGDNFYVVERGKFQIFVHQDDGSRQIRGEYEDNGFFGELALMYNQPRAATVVALSEGSLWAMDRNTFRRIVLKSAFKKRKEYEALFEKVSVLQCLNVSILSVSLSFV